jgi:hypothetical protein
VGKKLTTQCVGRRYSYGRLWPPFYTRGFFTEDQKVQPRLAFAIGFSAPGGC